MIQENPDRNSLIYELWKESRSIDEISLETGIPRSTVGYYVRKFNKRAKSGEPLVFQRVRAKRDEKTMVTQAFVKGSFYVNLMEMLKKGELDEVYKRLMILKLLKELQRDVFPTEEERQAFLKILGYVTKQK